jgi:uncharacterized protein YdiU (UPF0061 family)
MVYCPPLDLVGYGNDEEGARTSFEIVLNEYLQYTVNKGSLASDLKKLGWNIKKRVDKKLTPPTMAHLLQNNEDFSNIFNNHNFKKEDKSINMPIAV